jgi:hypothetical protein
MRSFRGSDPLVSSFDDSVQIITDVCKTKNVTDKDAFLNEVMDLIMKNSPAEENINSKNGTLETIEKKHSGMKRVKKNQIRAKNNIRRRKRWERERGGGRKKERWKKEIPKNSKKKAKYIFIYKKKKKFNFFRIFLKSIIFSLPTSEKKFFFSFCLFFPFYETKKRQKGYDSSHFIFFCVHQKKNQSLQCYYYPPPFFS